MDDVKSNLTDLLHQITDNEEYIFGILDNAPHDDDGAYMCRYIESHPNVTISDMILMSAELGMIRDGELEPLPDNEGW